MCGLGGGCRHRLRRSQRDGVGRRAGARGGASEQDPGALAGGLGFEVEQRTIQRVAGGACRHRGLQGLPVEPPPQRLLHRLEGGQGRFRGLAIARIGHAFAAPAKAAAADFHDHRYRLGLGAAADGEGAGNRPVFDSSDKAWGLAWRFDGSHFKIWQFLNRSLARRNQVWLVRQASCKAMAACWNFTSMINSEESTQGWTS